jgi:hypothetical protein
MMFRTGPDDVRSRKQGLIDALGGDGLGPNPALENTGVSGGLPMPPSPLADAPAAGASASNYGRTMGFDAGQVQRSQQARLQVRRGTHDLAVRSEGGLHAGSDRRAESSSGTARSAARATSSH